MTRKLICQRCNATRFANGRCVACGLRRPSQDFVDDKARDWTKIGVRYNVDLTHERKLERRGEE